MRIAGSLLHSIADQRTVKQAAAEAQDRLKYDLAQDHTTRHRRRGFRRDREDQLELAMALREWKEYVKAKVSAELCGARREQPCGINRNFETYAVQPRQLIESSDQAIAGIDARSRHGRQPATFCHARLWTKARRSELCPEQGACGTASSGAQRAGDKNQVAGAAARPFHRLSGHAEGRSRDAGLRPKIRVAAENPRAHGMAGCFESSGNSLLKRCICQGHGYDQPNR